MRIHYLQHVPFEGLGYIETWAGTHGHPITVTRLFAGDPFPDLESFEWLFVMGGPMGIYDQDRYPWLASEKRFIEKAVEDGKTVIGICLGAQLIAHVLGAEVYPNRFKEIGWFPVTTTEHARNSRLFGGLPEQFTAFHWHGDTFDLPDGAHRLAGSRGCVNQAFQYGTRVFGFQFHLETTKKSAGDLIANCRDDMVKGDYIQPPEEMLADSKKFETINRYLDELLTRMEEFYHESGR